MGKTLPGVFIEGLRQLGLQVTERQLDQFLRYQQELLDWNTRINLTAITDAEEVSIQHFLDSLALLMVFHKPSTLLIDIGTGAGFLRLPLKIMLPKFELGTLEDNST